MLYSYLTIEEKENIVRDIIHSYILIQKDLMVQESNEANDFCWKVFESLNALNAEEKKFIISYFFKKKDTIKDKSENNKMNRKNQKAIE